MLFDAGYFTAPVRGVYYFSFTSFWWGANPGSCGGSLYKNGNKIVSWYVTNSNHASSGSNSAVLQLQVGDNVNVRLWNNRRISDNTNKYSSFSGFLLFPVWSVWKHCDFQTDHTSNNGWKITKCDVTFWSCNNCTKNLMYFFFFLLNWSMLEPSGS